MFKFFSAKRVKIGFTLSVCDLSEVDCSGLTYEALATYCATEHPSCTSVDCITFVSGLCGLFSPEE